MSLKRVARNAIHCVRMGLVSAAMFQLTVGQSWALPQANAEAAAKPSRSWETETPIKHVIVIIGENRSFDHVFATYVPKSGESVWNLLSEGIVDADGKPGKNFAKAAQKAATDEQPDAFLLNPAKKNFPQNVLPAPLLVDRQTPMSLVTALCWLKNPRMDCRRNTINTWFQVELARLQKHLTSASLM